MSELYFVGLDVHKESIAIAVAEGNGADPRYVATIPHDIPTLLRRLRKLVPNNRLRVAYEAGPTGFGMYRRLTAEGIECAVIAPSLVPQQSGDRVKTDRRDALKLARFLRSGDLTSVYVPSEETEAMRDLERARGDAKKAERVARQQLLKFLLRHERRYTKGGNWTQTHLDWVRSQKFEQPALGLVLVDYLETVERATKRVVELTTQIGAQVESWSHAPVVKALQSLRGVQMITAVTIAAELGDLRRFASAPELMSYLGLVPSEHSSGDRTRRGSITRAGNTHVRRVLVEAAWSYRYRPNKSAAIRKRNEGLAQEIQDISWKAQKRLHHRYTRMKSRGKAHNKVVVAVARELAGFVWSIGRQQAPAA